MGWRGGFSVKDEGRVTAAGSTYKCGRQVVGGYLLPGVQLEGSGADFPDLLLTGSKQKVPMRPGRQRHLGDKHSFVTFPRVVRCLFK